jgi:drug/metabolite transporter (DMT)-like permease
MNNAEAIITHPHRQYIGFGALFAIISAFSFAVMSVFVKKIGTDLPTSMPIFFSILDQFYFIIALGVTQLVFSI